MSTELSSIYHGHRRELQTLLKLEKVRRLGSKTKPEYNIPYPVAKLLNDYYASQSHFEGPNFVKPVEETPKATPGIPKRKTASSVVKSKDSSIYGHAFYSWNIERDDIPSRSRGRVGPKHRPEEKIKTLTLKAIGRGSVNRLLFRDEIETEEQFTETLKKRMKTISCNTVRYPDGRLESDAQRAIERLKQYDRVIITNVRVEGLNFFKGDEFEETDALKVIRHIDEKVLCLNNRIYFTEGSEAALITLLNSRPVSKEDFIRSISTGFIEHIIKQKDEKIYEIQSLQDKITRLHKDIGELTFTEKAVFSNTNTHFEGVIEKIEAIPVIQELKLLKTGFMFKTRDLWIDRPLRNGEERKVPGERVSRHYVGPFEVYLELIGGFSIRYRNLAAPKKAYSNTPHGSCTGSHTYVIGNCLKNLDYYSFVLAVIEMLQNVNASEYSRYTLNSRGWTETKPNPNTLVERKSFTTVEISDYDIKKGEEHLEDEIDDEDEDLDDDDDEDLDDDDDEDLDIEYENEDDEDIEDENEDDDDDENVTITKKTLNFTITKKTLRAPKNI